MRRRINGSGHARTPVPIPAASSRLAAIRIATLSTILRRGVYRRSTVRAGTGAVGPFGPTARIGEIADAERSRTRQKEGDAAPERTRRQGDGSVSHYPDDSLLGTDPETDLFSLVVGAAGSILGIALVVAILLMLR